MRSGKFVLRLSSEMHDKLKKIAFNNEESLNQVCVRFLEEGVQGFSKKGSRGHRHPHCSNPETLQPELAVQTLLSVVDSLPQRVELKRTPRRVLDLYTQLTKGRHIDPIQALAQKRLSSPHQQLITLHGIRFVSLCEHHLMPFYGDVFLAYIPDQYIAGLSHLTKMVESYAERLQLQERLTDEICQGLRQALNPLGVGVVVRATQLCLNIQQGQSLQTQFMTSQFWGEMQNTTSQNTFMHQIQAFGQRVF